MIDNRDFKYNRRKDISKVPQYGFIDLHECYRSGIVPSNIEEASVEYNNIENLDNIVGKPSDVFEAYRMQNAIRSIAENQSSGGENSEI